MLATDFELQDGDGNGWPPPGTLPPGSPMKKYEKFVPSKQTVSLIQEGVALLGDVFDYSAEVEASYGVGLNFKAGPLKGKVEASVASISASSNNTNILEVEAKGLDASVEGGLGDNKATAGITGVSGKVEINKKTLKPTASGELVKGSASAKKGSISLSNSGTLSLGGKIGPVKASVSADLYKAAKGLSKIVQSGVSYLTDYLSHTFD